MIPDVESTYLPRPSRGNHGPLTLMKNWALGRTPDRVLRTSMAYWSTFQTCVWNAEVTVLTRLCPSRRQLIMSFHYQDFHFVKKTNLRDLMSVKQRARGQNGLKMASLTNNDRE